MFFDWDQAQNQFLMVAHLTLQNHYTRRPIYKNIYIIYILWTERLANKYMAKLIGIGQTTHLIVNWNLKKRK